MWLSGTGITVLLMPKNRKEKEESRDQEIRGSLVWPGRRGVEMQAHTGMVLAYSV